MNPVRSLARPFGASPKDLGGATSNGMKFYDDIKSERDRIESCIKKFGHTSDHNLDWWVCSIITPDAVPVFVQWPDGSGLLTYKYPGKWYIWSDPLSLESDMIFRIEEFCSYVLAENSIKEVWCGDVADSIYPALKNQPLKLNGIYYSLLWPVLNMVKYDISLPGGHFKEIRNAKSKFYREHQVKILDTDGVAKEDLYRIVDAWQAEALKKERKEDVFDLKYRLAIKNNFTGFITPRVLVVSGRPVGFNAGYEVPNRPGRFAGIIGLHDYSVKDLGTVLWLEDLEWIKSAGYKELDMQGSEPHNLKTKTQFGAAIERKTDTFSISKRDEVF